MITPLRVEEIRKYETLPGFAGHEFREPLSSEFLETIDRLWKENAQIGKENQTLLDHVLQDAMAAKLRQMEGIATSAIRYLRTSIVVHGEGCTYEAVRAGSECSCGAVLSRQALVQSLADFGDFA